MNRSAAGPRAVVSTPPHSSFGARFGTVRAPLSIRLDCYPRAALTTGHSFRAGRRSPLLEQKIYFTCDRFRQGLAATDNCGAAELTVTGPAPLTRAEWPRIPGEDPPGQVAVNGRPWTVDETDPNRVIATTAS